MDTTERITYLSCKEFTGWDTYFKDTKIIGYLDNIVADTLKSWEDNPVELNPADELHTLCFEGTILKNLIEYWNDLSVCLPIFIVPTCSTLDVVDGIKVNYVTGIRVTVLDNIIIEKEDQKYREDDFPRPVIADTKSYISRRAFYVDIQFRPEHINKFRGYALKHFEYKNYGGEQ